MGVCSFAGPTNGHTSSRALLVHTLGHSSGSCRARYAAQHTRGGYEGATTMTGCVLTHLEGRLSPQGRCALVPSVLFAEAAAYQLA